MGYHQREGVKGNGRNQDRDGSRGGDGDAVGSVTCDRDDAGEREQHKGRIQAGEQCQDLRGRTTGRSVRGQTRVDEKHDDGTTKGREW